jgi:hypothetical protein
MGKARFDTYEVDQPDKPPFPPYASLLDARNRKQDLKQQGYRVKIRKDEGAYTLLKKRDHSFFLDKRRDNNG